MLQVVQDGLGQLVADVALAHGAGLGERHLGRLAVVGGRVRERVVDHADLRAVAVGHDDVGALLDHVDDVLGGVLHQLELLLGRVAQGVAAQRDDDGLTFTLLIRHAMLSFSRARPTRAAGTGGEEKAERPLAKGPLRGPPTSAGAHRLAGGRTGLLENALTKKPGLPRPETVKQRIINRRTLAAPAGRSAPPAARSPEQPTCRPAPAG